MDYYVYVYKDPLTNLPFYVGKGKKLRAYSHLNLRLKGLRLHNRDLSTKIDEILMKKSVPIIEIVCYFDDELKALDYETSLITSIGLENLTNKISAAWPCKLSPEILARRGLTCKNNPKWRQTMSSKEHKEKLSNAVKEAIKARGGRPPLSDQHRAAVSKGLEGKLKGEKNPCSKNTPEQIYEYLTAVMNGAHWKKTALKMGIANAWNIVQRKAWTHIEAPPGYYFPSKRKFLCETDIQIVIEMNMNGESKRKIASKIGYSVKTVNCILKNHNEKLEKKD